MWRQWRNTWGRLSWCFRDLIKRILLFLLGYRAWNLQNHRHEALQHGVYDYTKSKPWPTSWQTSWNSCITSTITRVNIWRWTAAVRSLAMTTLPTMEFQEGNRVWF
jgi:hypothetical protein